MLCPADCKHLSLTEEQQNKSERKEQHRCNKYQVQVMHLNAHPELYRCLACLQGGYE